MARTLDVYLHRDLIGHLVQDDGGKMVFGYVESWLSRPGATPLSHSLPLRPKRFGRNECRGYFAGILPEASKRDVIARNLGISARNDYAMLERIGGECAGAVTFIPHGRALPEPNYSYRKLTPGGTGGDSQGTAEATAAGGRCGYQAFAGRCAGQGCSADGARRGLSSAWTELPAPTYSQARR